MTLLPHENRNVTGLEGPAFLKYQVGPVCAHPTCSRYADHSHHLWRRSFLGGDFSWVELWDHTILGNLSPLCWRHHDLITENKEGIVWDGAKFVWIDNKSRILGELFPQPPVHGKPQVAQVAQPDGPASGEVCPGCHRVIPKKKEPGEQPEAVRRRKTWTVTVPDDGEDGALVLDQLLEICSELFKHGEGKNLRYFTLVQALALVAQHGHVMLSESTTENVVSNTY